jgi:hypothetical protein
MDVIPWNKGNHVLSLGSFPSTLILRKPKDLPRTAWGSCGCTGDDKHRSLFDFNQTVVFPFLKGTSTEPMTGYKVCWNAENMWECKLPRALTGLERRVTFVDLPSVYSAQIVLFRGTHWFRRLIAPDGKDSKIKHGVAGLAVLRMLAGLTGFSGKERIDQLVKMPIVKGGVHKLRNLLATVDGMLMQLATCFPGDKEIQSWTFMDQVVHCLISGLLPDYLRVGQPKAGITTFEKVKNLRKEIKAVGFNPIGEWSSIDVPQELSFFRPILRRMTNRQSPWRGFQTTALSQTRASGVPPRSVYLKTMDKLMALFKEPSSMDSWNSFGPFIRPALDEIHQEVILRHDSKERLEKFFSKCVNGAKVSLSDSGEFFTKEKDGGKLEAARKVLIGIDKIEKINLVTGEFTGEFLTKGEDSAGEILFMWACHKFHNRKVVYDTNAMSVRISLVAELGKWRGITISHLAHAVLLHVLNHVLLAYIADIPSSRDGIGAANHGWKFFQRLSHKNPEAGFLFNKEPNFLFSTDWTQSTDYCDHYIAAGLLNNLCDILGIPKWYRQTCVFALCGPRQIEFLDPEERTLEMFLSTRGVLMGDPVTKPVLHLYHIVVRTAIKQLMRRYAATNPLPPV